MNHLVDVDQVVVVDVATWLGDSVSFPKERLNSCGCSSRKW